MGASRVAVITCDSCGSNFVGDSLSITTTRLLAGDLSGWHCGDDGDHCAACATPALPGMAPAPTLSVAVPPGHDLEPRSTT